MDIAILTAVIFINIFLVLINKNIMTLHESLKEYIRLYVRTKKDSEGK